MRTFLLLLLLLAPGPAARSCGAGEPAQEAPAGQREVIAVQRDSLELGAQPVHLTIPLGREARQRLARSLAREGPAVALVFEGLRYARNPGIYYEIYLGLPQGAPVPGPASPHYVGNLAFYGPARDGTSSQDLDLTPALRKLGWRGEGLALTFVPQGWIPSGGGEETAVCVKIDRVAIALE